MAGNNVILSGAELVISSERARDAPGSACVARCLACRAESGLVGYEERVVAVWAMEHARQRGVEHSQFVVTTRQHWRAHPHRSAAPVPAPQTPPPPGGRAAHARPPAGVLGALARFRRRQSQS
jgi:hypothetical protein